MGIYTCFNLLSASAAFKRFWKQETEVKGPGGEGCPLGAGASRALTCCTYLSVVFHM